VWPFGATPARLEIASELGFRFSLTLEPSPPDVGPFAIHRYFPTGNPGLGESSRTCASSRPAPAPAHRLPAARRHRRRWTLRRAGRALGRSIEDVRTLGANTVMIHAHAALAPGEPIGAVFFPTSLLPLKADLLSRVSWQLRTAAPESMSSYADRRVAPRRSARRACRRSSADMAKYTVTDGLSLDLA
jgi:biofilm PGA synthesis lipoprotein PgaB